jgi:hypothetical protein
VRSASYLRYTPGDERRTHHSRFERLDYDHPLVGQICSECGRPIRAKQKITLFAVGPDNREAAIHEAKGEVYNALAVAMHENCAWPEASD